MLEITIKETELFDDSKQEFIHVKEQTLRLEHSLVSLSKWESKWHKPFISNQQPTREETLDYIKCMTLTQNVDQNVYNCITNKHIYEINKYIEDPMTATTFGVTNQKGGSREVITSELIYYWMIALNIPVEFQKWHLNRLLTLIRVCNIKNAPPKKLSRSEIMSRHAAINAANKKRFNTKG